MDSTSADRAKGIIKDSRDEKQASEIKEAGKRANAAVERASEGAKDVTKTASVAVGHAAEGTKEVLSDVREGARDAGSAAGSAAQKAAGHAVESGKEVLSGVREGTKALGDAAQKAAGHAAESGKEIIGDITTGAKDLASTTLSAAGEAKEALQHAGGEVSEIVKGATGRAVDSLSSAAHQIGPSLRRANRTTGRFVASNALPIALLGFGAGWLLTSARRRPSAPGELSRTLESKISASPPEMSPSEPIKESLREGAREGKRLVEDTQELVHDATSSAREGVRRVGAEARSRAADLTQRAVHQIEHARDAARDGAVRLKHGAGETFDRVKQSTTHLAEAQPLMLVALSLGAGAGTAMLFPSSKSEKRLLGPARDRFVDEASDAASRVGGIARDAARDLRDKFRH